MRLVACGITAIGLLLSLPSHSLARCGKDPGDLPAVAATQATAAAECTCCATASSKAKRSRCVRGVARAAVAFGALPSRCVGAVARSAAHACPLGPQPSPACQVCKSNADCQPEQ